MDKYQIFTFDWYKLDQKAKKIELAYSLDDTIHFTETITLPNDYPFTESIDEVALDKSLFMLHLIGGISYYKTYLPREIIVRSGQLTAKQADFWDTVYENGLGEFFFRNSIDFLGLIHFPITDPARDTPRLTMPTKSPEQLNYLIPFGGGKDSVVTTEIIKQHNLPATLFRMGSHPLITESAKVTTLPLLIVERSLSPNLFELNSAGAYNGHIPITAYVSFLTIVISLLYGFDAVVMSNERSANYGNVMYLGQEINHQWSKSLQFEIMLQEYIRDYIAPDFYYLNLLRPFSELTIAKNYSTYPQYFSNTTSCNTNWKILKEENTSSEQWCGECPKCAFAFAIFAAFLPLSTVESMFHQNLFNKPGLLPLYRQLLNLEGFKPFECVGTPEETQAALALAIKSEEYKNTLVGQLFITEALPDIANIDQVIKETLSPQTNYPISQLVQTILEQTELL